MGTIADRHVPCINPDCGSSDAMSIYDKGDAYCFSCHRSFSKSQVDAALAGGSVVKPDSGDEEGFTVTSATRTYCEQTVTVEDVAEFGIRGFKERGITKAVCEFFGVRVGYDSAGEICEHYYPYKVEDGFSYKRRVLPKKFTWVGPAGEFFGTHLFATGGKRLIITEGEIDALSVAQASMDRYKKIYPVISLPTSANAQHLIMIRDWIRGFKEVVVMMDNDEAGRDAMDKALKIIGVDRARIPTYPEGCKDANDVLFRLGSEALNQVIWDASPWSPAGIIGRTAIWKAVTEYNAKVALPYPTCLGGLNAKLRGARGGEIALFISGTGSGKSTVMREIMLEFLKTPEVKIGVVSLEESPAETAIKLAGMAMSRNLSNEDEPPPIEELKVGFDDVFGEEGTEERVILLDHQGAVSDASIIDKLEYMCLMGCKYLFIDHITILVSEGADGLSGNEAIDKVMNDLLRLVKRYPDVWIGLVSHLRKTSLGKSFEQGKMPNLDDIRGSGSIKQISFDIIAFARDMTDEDESIQNQIMMAVLKARYTGKLGPVEGSFFDQTTGRLLAARNGAQAANTQGFTKLIPVKEQSSNEQKQSSAQGQNPLVASGIPDVQTNLQPSTAGLKVPRVSF